MAPDLYWQGQQFSHRFCRALPPEETARFEFLPGFEAGATKLVVGPVSLPGKAPGGLDVQGKIVIGDVSGAQVACIALDLHLELFAAPLTAGRPWGKRLSGPERGGGVVG